MAALIWVLISVVLALSGIFQTNIDGKISNGDVPFAMDESFNVFASLVNYTGSWEKKKGGIKKKWERDRTIRRQFPSRILPQTTTHLPLVSPWGTNL